MLLRFVLSVSAGPIEKKELTPYNRVLLKMLRVTEIFTKFLTHYGPRTFLTTFTKTLLLVPILSQIHPARALPTDFLDVNLV
jgi:hypothetical protein